MAWQFDVNNLVLGADDAGGNLGLLLLNHLVANGAATLIGAGDGIAAFANPEDNATDPNTVLTAGTATWPTVAANSFSNELAWIRWRMTDGTEFTFQRDSNGATAGQRNLTIAWSRTGFDDVGSASALIAPVSSIGDEQYLIGIPGFGGNAFSNHTVDIRIHVACEDTAQDSCFPFYWMITRSSDQDHSGLMTVDVIEDGDANDTHPYVATMWGAGVEPDITTHNGLPKAWRDPAGLNVYDTPNLKGLSGTAGSIVIPAGMPAQPDGLVRTCPVYYASNTVGWWKGQSRNFLWKGEAARIYPDTRELSTADARIYSGDLLLPWEQSTVPA